MSDFVWFGSLGPIYFNTPDGVDFGKPIKYPPDARVLEVYNTKLCKCKLSGAEWYEDTTFSRYEVKSPILLSGYVGRSLKQATADCDECNSLQRRLVERMWELCQTMYKERSLPEPKSTRDGELVGACKVCYTMD